MPVIAIAGGTGNLGRALVEAILAKGGSEVIILARNANPEKEAEIGVPVLAVDYSDPEALAKLFESKKVDTVISTIDSQAGPDPELGLIQAAEKSSITKRYIPCLWGLEYREEIIPYFPIAGTKVQIIEAVKKTNLEWTGVQPGLFTDFYVSPKVKSYLQPLDLVIDIRNAAAGIPGTGNEPVVFTHTFDVAKYVAGLVASKERWTETSIIVGDKLTWNEFVQIAEQVRNTKFNVTYDSIDTLKQGKVTELPSHSAMYPFFPKEAMQGMFSSFGLLFAYGNFDFKVDSTNSLNERFPDIKPRTVKELVQEAWGN